MLQQYALSSDLFDRLPSLLFRATLDGRFLQVNQAMLQMSQYPNEGSLLASHPEDIYIEEEERERWLSMLNYAVPCNNFELQFRCYDGTILWLKNNSYAVYDDRGELLYYEGSFEDVTQRKQAERALQEQQESLAGLLHVVIEMEALLGA